MLLHTIDFDGQAMLRSKLFTTTWLIADLSYVLSNVLVNTSRFDDLMIALNIGW